jgi:tight adherence protein C
MVVDATDHRQVGVIAIASSTVAAALALLAGHLAPHHRTRRVPTTVGTGVRRGRLDRRRPHAWVLALAPMAAIAAIATIAGFVAAGAAAGACAVELARRRYRRAFVHRRAIAAALPDAIEFLVLLVHAGLSPTQAVLDAAQRAPLATRAGFAATAHRLQRGQGLAEALSGLVDELGPAARPIADGIAAAERYGLPLAPLLDTLSHQAHASRRRLAEAEARRLPVRLSFPLVVCTLPSFVLLAVVPAVMGTISSLRGHPA